jgi:hypothetical protein
MFENSVKMLGILGFAGLGILIMVLIMWAMLYFAGKNHEYTE